MGYDITLGTVALKLDFPPPGVPFSGVQGYQDITPSDLEYKNSEPGFGDDTPYSSRVYATQNGGVGKYTEIEAPGDLTRPYLCDLDNTHPGFLAPHLVAPITAAFQVTPGGSTMTGGIAATLETATYGSCAIAQTNGGTDAGAWLYQWDATNNRYSYIRRLNFFFGAAGNVTLGAQWRAQPSNTRGFQAGGKLWIPYGTGGLIDATTAYSQTPQATGTIFWHGVMLGPILFTFEQTDFSGATPGMTINARDPSALTVYTPATLSGVAAPELGNANISVSVPDVLMCWAPIVYNGAVYFASDRAVYKMIYDDANAKIVVVPLRTKFTRVTSNPEIFQGSLIVASGNTLWKWTPGQEEFTPVPVDTFGELPFDKGGGIITRLLTVADAMYMVATSVYGAGDGTLLRMDSNSVVTVKDWRGDATGVYVTYYGSSSTDLYSFVAASTSSSFAPYVGVLAGVTGSAPFRVIPLFETNHNPTFLPAASRKQDGNSHFWLSPWDPGQAYGDRKDLLKLVADVADVNSACKIRIYYQTNYSDRLADSLDSANGGFSGTISNTVMAGQGAWTLAQSLFSGAQGLTLVGTGYQGYAEKSFVGTQVPYSRIRWCVEIIGDTSGTLYPRLYGLRFIYSETPAKYVLWNVRVRVMMNDPDLAGLAGVYVPPAGLPDVPVSVADVYTVWNKLWGYAKAGTFISFLDINGDSRVVKISKFRYDVAEVDDTVDGIPTAARRRARKIILNLALQEGDSAA